MPTLEEYRKQTVASLESLGIKTTEQDLVVPAMEGFDFGAGSFIARWSMGRYYRVSSDVDYVTHNQENDTAVPSPDIPRVQWGEWYQMFYKSKEIANGVHKSLNPDNEILPRLYWVFYAPTSSMKNASDLSNVARGFGDTFVFCVRIVALSKGHKRNDFGKRTDRHEYNFISLPPAVVAVADLRGYEVPEYDLSLLTAPGAADEFDEEFFLKHMGDPRGDYEGCTFDGYRKAVWAALGESDPRKTAIKGSKYIDKKGVERPESLATDSDKLSECLGIAQGTGEGGGDITLWARLINVPNPKQEERAFPVPAITEIFVSEEHATLVGQAELAERGTTADEGQSVVSHPPLSKGWTGGTVSDIVTLLTSPGTDDNGNPIASIIDRMASAKVLPQRNKLVEDSFLDNWEDLVAWAQYIERAEEKK